MKQIYQRMLVSSAAALLLPCDECGAPSEARCMQTNGKYYRVIPEIVHPSRRAKVKITSPHQYVNWKINHAAETELLMRLRYDFVGG